MLKKGLVIGMEYLSTYYWQQEGRNTSSLMLLQAYHRKRQIPVLLACICEGDIAEFFSNWFYETGLPLCGRGTMRGWNKAVKSLERFLSTVNDGGKCVRFAGILCAGNRFIRFDYGGGKMFLLNMRNLKANWRALGKLSMPNADGFYVSAKDADKYKESKSDVCELEQGELQGGIGILLVTHDFALHMERSRSERKLHLWELRQESYMEENLRKLGKQFEQEHGVNMGAILIGVA